MAARKRANYRERLIAIESRAGVLIGVGGRTLRLKEYGVLGILTAKAFVAYERASRTGEQAYAHQLMRAVSFAQLVMVRPGTITDPLRAELRAMFSPTRPKQSVHRWQADKHPDALALFEELTRAGHL